MKTRDNAISKPEIAKETELEIKRRKKTSPFSQTMDTQAISTIYQMNKLLSLTPMQEVEST